MYYITFSIQIFSFPIQEQKEHKGETPTPPAVAVLFKIQISLIDFVTFTSSSFWIRGAGWEYVNLMVKTRLYGHFVKTRLYGHSCAANITLRKLPILCQIMSVWEIKHIGISFIYLM